MEQHTIRLKLGPNSYSSPVQIGSSTYHDLCCAIQKRPGYDLQVEYKPPGFEKARIVRNNEELLKAWAETISRNIKSEFILKEVALKNEGEYEDINNKDVGKHQTETSDFELIESQSYRDDVTPEEESEIDISFGKDQNSNAFTVEESSIINNHQIFESISDQDTSTDNLSGIVQITNYLDLLKNIFGDHKEDQIKEFLETDEGKNPDIMYLTDGFLAFQEDREEEDIQGRTTNATNDSDRDRDSYIDSDDFDDF